MFSRRVSSVCGAYGSGSAGKGYHPVPCKKHQLILNLKSNSEFVGQQGPPPVPSRICASLCDFSRRDFGCGHGDYNWYQIQVILATLPLQSLAFIPFPDRIFHRCDPDLLRRVFPSELGVHCQATVSCSCAVAHRVVFAA